MENIGENKVLAEENRRLFETSGKLLIENNRLRDRIDYLEGEIRKNNGRIFKRKISL